MNRKTIKLSRNLRARGMVDGGVKIYRNCPRDREVVWLSKSERAALYSALNRNDDQAVIRQPVKPSVETAP